MYKKIILWTIVGIFVYKNGYTSIKKETIFPEDNKNLTFQTEIAKTDEEKSLGLMYRKTLEPQTGMLFCFNDNIYPITMWMKNTNIALDMLFFDADKNLVGIYKEAKPNSLENIYAPSNTSYVLEINAGEIDKLKLTKYKKWQIAGCNLRQPSKNSL